MPNSFELIINDVADDPIVTEELRAALLLDLEESNADIEMARPREGPHGARGGADDIYTLIGVAASPAVLRAVLDIARSWLMRQTGGSVTVKLGEDQITIEAATRRDHRELIDSFVKRHEA